jgi:hypothetical protein
MTETEAGIVDEAGEAQHLKRLRSARNYIGRELMLF